MAAIDTLHCLFTAQIRQDNGTYVIDIPDRELDLGAIEDNGQYRVAILPATSRSDAEGKPRTKEQLDEAPVEEGDNIEVEIKDIGTQGDGVARLDGYVIFVPNTTLNERVSVEITEARENMAFAEVVGRLDAGI